MSKFIFAFLLLYISGIFATIFVDIAWGVYLYEITYYLNPVSKWWYGHLPHMRWSFIISIAIFIAFVFRKQNYTQNRIFEISSTKWLIALTIVVIATYPLAVWPEMHQKALINHVKLMLFIAILYKVVDQPFKFERMIWSFLVGNFYLGWVAHNTGRTAYGRLDGIGPADGTDSNMTGSVMICAVPILLFYLIRGKLWQKFTASFFLAYILNGIVLLNSRGTFIGLAAGITLFVFFLLFNRLKGGTNKVMLLSGVCFGVVLFLYLADITFWERMFTLSEVSSGGGGSERIYFWVKAWEVAKENPFGLGTWGFLHISPEILPEEMLDQSVKMRAIHSTYLSTLVELGFLGFFLYLFYLVSVFRIVKKIMSYSVSLDNSDMYYHITALVSSFVAFLIASVFIDRFYAELMYWIPAFIACFFNIYVIKRCKYSLNLSPESGTPSDK